MVGMFGMLLGQGLSVQAEPCFAPGVPIASVKQQPLYMETDDPGLVGPPDALYARPDGLLHLLCRSAGEKGRHNGASLETLLDLHDS